MIIKKFRPLLHSQLGLIPEDQRPNRFELLAVYIIYAGIVARTLTWVYIRHLLSWYIGGETLYLILFTLILFAPKLPTIFIHLYFVLQSLIILFLFSLWPDFSFIVILFIPLCYQVALIFSDRIRYYWITIILLLLGSSMFYFQGLRGFAEGLIPMAGGFIFSTYVILRKQIIFEDKKIQETLEKLQKTNEQIKNYTIQVEELTAINERNRLARDLHDSVAQSLFGIALNARSAQILAARDPEQLKEHLETLQDQTQSALDRMRRFIAELWQNNPS